MANIAYTTVGSGKIGVLVAHSWLADHQTFSPMVPYLDTKTYTFVFPDYRGYGKSIDIKGSFDTHEMGADLISVADELGWNTFHLVGHSMSGQVAQWLAGNKEHGKRIRSLTLLCAVPAAGFPLDEQGAAFFGAAAGSAEVRAQCTTAVTGGRLGEGFATYMADLSMKTATSEAIAGYLRTWTQQDVSAELVPYEGPVRAFVGQFDPVLTLELAQKTILPFFPQAELATIEGAAHYPSTETPAYVARLINDLDAGRT